jgi:hypothetical protein
VAAGARCVAVESAVKERAGPPLGAPRGALGANDDAAWLLDVISFIRGQDNAYFSKKHILALTADKAPLVVKHRSGVSTGLVYMLLVVPNAVSTKAALLMRALLREQDRCIIAHYVQHKSQVDQAMKGFLKAYEVCCCFEAFWP